MSYQYFFSGDFNNIMILLQEINNYEEAKQQRQNIFAEIQYPFHLVLKKVYFKDCLCGTYGDCKKTTDTRIGQEKIN